MEEFEIRLNNFLFNSGVLGFYRILKYVGKKELLVKENNVLRVKAKALEGFEDDYIRTMIHEFKKDTRWYTITENIDKVQNLNLENKEEIKAFKNSFDLLKKALESASYKSAYDIIKLDNDTFNPYAILDIAKNEKDLEAKRQAWIQLAKYLKLNEEVYCMKDIIYTKINIFWENVAFLNRNSNKSKIKEEYKKTFVIPAIEHLKTKQKSDYNCIECGNVVSKSQTSAMSWIKDVGVDINRKKSAFWNFKEDTFLCPICNLIYSCIPLGFYLIKSNGIFINCNKNMDTLIRENDSIKVIEMIEKETISQTYHRMFRNLLNRGEQTANEEMSYCEPQNIQVVKRIGKDKDNMRYEFSTISKEKLEIFNLAKEKFEKLLDRIIILNKDTPANRTIINIYEQTVSDFLENRKPYHLLDLIVRNSLNDNTNINYAINILKIRLYEIQGGVKMKEMDELIEEMIKAGRELQLFYYFSDENENKLKSYVLNITNSLRTNNINMFMDVVTRMYGSLGKPIPSMGAFEKMLKDEEAFRTLGYAYVIGIKGKNAKKENEGGNKDEE